MLCLVFFISIIISLQIEMFIPIVSCDIVIYFIYIYTYLVTQRSEIYFSDIFGLHVQFLYGSQTPCNFLSDESNHGLSCYVDEVTFGPYPKVGLVANAANHVIRESELSVPYPDFQANYQWPMTWSIMTI